MRNRKPHSDDASTCPFDVSKRDIDLGAVLTSMLAALPRVVVKRRPNSTSFRVGRKVFAFTTKRGAAILKLPVETVEALVKNNTAARVVMGRRVMKEWVVIQYESPTDSRKHLRLFREALAFVSASED